jgi:hypothetical protein
MLALFGWGERYCLAPFGNWQQCTPASCGNQRYITMSNNIWSLHFKAHFNIIIQFMLRLAELSVHIFRLQNFQESLIYLLHAACPSYPILLFNFPDISP